MSDVRLKRPYPHEVKVALRALWASWWLTILHALLTGIEMTRAPAPGWFVATLGVPVALVLASYAWLLWRTRRRWVWGPGLLGIWLLGNIALHASVLLKGVGTVWYVQAFDYGTTALEALGVALLWQKPARDWFRDPGAVAGALQQPVGPGGGR